MRIYLIDEKRVAMNIGHSHGRKPYHRDATSLFRRVYMGSPGLPVMSQTVLSMRSFTSLAKLGKRIFATQYRAEIELRSCENYSSFMPTMALDICLWKYLNCGSTGKPKRCLSTYSATPLSEL